MENANVYWVLELNILEGQLENLKTLMTEMVKATKANEPGALNYEWHFNDEETTCTIYERYADADATMTHLDNFGAFAVRFFAALQPTRFTIFGAADERIKEALSAFGPVYLNAVAGFVR